MGDLSENFSHKDFVCRCNQCRGEEFKIHLGLVGILEQLTAHFKKKVIVGSAFWCDDFLEHENKEKRSFHNKGKAVHLKIEDTAPAEIFKFVEGIAEINGIGLYPKEEFVHLDTRPKEKRSLWVKEGTHYTALTPEKRKQWNL
ncbi:MAG: DUF882 domain-containing protein [Candidatus Saganbacteria bacterium]|nr:DUF882 domain-containing protein [Candidatus Saganbacteria bacterium]